MNPQLTICIVNYNTADFIKIILESIDKLTSTPIKIIICDNGSGLKDKIKLIKLTEGRCNCKVLLREQSEAGSIGHGEALDIIVSMLDTEYFIALDSDAVFLQKNWDRILIERLTENIGAIGSQAAGDKPKDFPLMYAVLFRTAQFRKLKCTFLPQKTPNGEIVMDTGMSIREAYLEAGLQSEVLKFVNTRHDKTGPFAKVNCAEFYLSASNLDKDQCSTLFLSHYGRGATLGRAKMKGALFQLPIIGRWATAYWGYRGKAVWINQCRKIINEQSSHSTPS